TGVIGVAGPFGDPVEGHAFGVIGVSRVTGGTGVLGFVGAPGPHNEGVRGEVTSAQGTGGVFANSGGGSILVGQAGPDFQNKFRVDGAGNLFVTGSINAYSPFADVGERIATVEALKPGDVVEIDRSHAGHFRKSRSKFNTAVAGIVSTAPAITLSSSGEIATPEADVRPVLALVGRVPISVSNESG